jgi:hypothetical protein
MTVVARGVILCIWPVLCCHFPQHLPFPVPFTTVVVCAMESRLVCGREGCGVDGLSVKVEAAVGTSHGTASLGFTLW